MEALVAFITKVDNLAVLVLMMMCAGLGYMHVVWRKEEREDRVRMLETINKNTDALNSLKNVLSAQSGRPL